MGEVCGVGGEEVLEDVGGGGGFRNGKERSRNEVIFGVLHHHLHCIFILD